MTSRGALRAATIALLATAARVAAPTVLDAQDIECDRGDQEVRALDFRGNRFISDEDLALRVSTTASSWGRRNLRLWFGERCLNRAELPRDLLRLRAYYRERGFYSARVDTLVQPLGGDAVRVVFLIEEGEPLRVTTYSVTGLEGIADSADIMRRLRLRVGAPFDFGLFRADMDSIVRRLRDAGYYRVETVPGYDTDTTAAKRADAFISVRPGLRARFGLPKIEVTPAEGREQEISEPVVRRVLGIVPGALYSDRAILEAQRNLFQLGTYRHIEVAPLPDSQQTQGDTVVLLQVTLTEDLMRQLDSEFGWATLDCGRVRLQFIDRNLFGAARRIELTGQASKIGFGTPLETDGTRRLCENLGRTSDLAEDEFSRKLHYFTGMTWRQPRLLGTRWLPAVSLYSERRGEFKAYLRTTEVGGDFAATRDVGERMPLRIGYSMEYGQTEAPDASFCALFNRCDPATRAPLQTLEPLGVFSTTLGRIRTDNLISPTRGYTMRGEFRSSAAGFLGTDPSLYFTKGTADLAWYQPLGSTAVFAFRLRGGLVFGRTSGAFIPPQERLYAGGPTSVRGFQQNELGAAVYIARASAVDSTLIEVRSTGDTVYQFMVSGNPDSIQSPDRTVPLGGNSLFVANIEYRIRDPFFFPDLLQYTLFVDGGDVWASDQRSGRLKWTPGLGFRALTPVGPVQVNIGYNRYQREQDAIYYNPNVNTLACATPGNSNFYFRGPSTGGQLLDVDPNPTPCLRTFTPPPRNRFLQRLTFTFSIGSDF
jgi:outer membrane protein insertion porin family/translocation and assembly module TamA